MKLMFEELSKLFPKSSPQILQDICEALSSQALSDTNVQTENQSPSVFEPNAQNLGQNCDIICEGIFNLPDFENAPNEKSSIMLEQSKKIKKQTIQAGNKKKENLEAPAKQAIPRRKDIWKAEEDLQLFNLYKEYGPKWSKIASLIPNRTGKQVRDRYLNTLRPDINHLDWTPEEQKKLESLYEQFGKKWCKIAEHLPGRTENQVKNKFYWEKKKKTSRKMNKMTKVLSKVAYTNLQPQNSAEMQITDNNENLSMDLNLDQISDDNFRDFTWNQEII